MYVCRRLVVLVCVQSALRVTTSSVLLDGLSRKFWSAENFGPGDQNSLENCSAGPLFSENFGPRMDLVESWWGG